MTPAAFLIGLALGFVLACWIVPLLDEWRADRLADLLGQARSQADRAQVERGYAMGERDIWRARYEQLRSSLGGASVTR